MFELKAGDFRDARPGGQTDFTNQPVGIFETRQHAHGLFFIEDASFVDLPFLRQLHSRDWIGKGIGEKLPFLALVKMPLIMFLRSVIMYQEPDSFCSQSRTSLARKFVYTPPSLRSQALSKARDLRHAAKMYKEALEEEQTAAAEGRESRWKAFHFTSHDNPHISKRALAEISRDMSSLSYRQEILAKDVDEVPGALWSIGQLENCRLHQPPRLIRVAVGMDPSGGSGECGIVVAGIAPCSCKGTSEIHGFVLADRSRKGTPDQRAKEAVAAYHTFHADRIFAEKNFGGDMVEATLRTVDPSIPFQSVSASRGKAVRAEPIAALYEQGKVHHVGRLDGLENEMISWHPGSNWSPNRLDALVWVLTELMLGQTSYEPAIVCADPPPEPRRPSIFDDGPSAGMALAEWPRHLRFRRDGTGRRTLW